MLEKLKRLVRDDRGPSAIEYGLIAALVAVAIIVALIAVGGALNSTFQTVANAL